MRYQSRTDIKPAGEQKEVEVRLSKQLSLFYRGNSRLLCNKTTRLDSDQTVSQGYHCSEHGEVILYTVKHISCTFQKKSKSHQVHQSTFLMCKDMFVLS